MGQDRRWLTRRSVPELQHNLHHRPPSPTIAYHRGIGPTPRISASRILLPLALTPSAQFSTATKSFRS